MTERLPWFPCDPSKLLGALAQMKRDEGYLYIIVLLRIYEIGGPCQDSLEALATRSRMSKRQAADHLDRLFKAGKLVRDGAGIMNPYAASVIDAQTLRRKSAKAAGESGARGRWEKPKQNQTNHDGKGIATPLRSDGYLDLDSEIEKKGRKRESRAGARTLLSPGWCLTVTGQSYATDHGFDVDRAIAMAGAFIDHHRSRGNRMADWDAAWRTWVRNEVKFSNRGGSGGANRQGGGPGRGSGFATLALNAAKRAGPFGGEGP